MDACSGGWVAAVVDGRTARVAFEPDRGFAATLAALAPLDRVLVDMPVGLPESGTRRCDDLARRVLGTRHATVFTPPTRSVVEDRAALDYEAARERNDGPTLSKQTWNIVPTVGEVDDALAVADGRAVVDGVPVRECHPEVALWALSGGFPLAYSKHDRRGLVARRRVLADHLANAVAAYDRAVEATLRKHVGRDDVLDALALAASGVHDAELASLPSSPPTDLRGLPMEIAFPETTGAARMMEVVADDNDADGTDGADAGDTDDTDEG
ncbi:MAG: DUF429 domain-containing protein [Halolamina sp.]